MILHKKQQHVLIRCDADVRSIVQWEG